MGILETLFAGHAGRWVQAQEAASVADIYIEALLFGGEDNDGNPYPGLIPGRTAERITYDLCDWEGISLEFEDYQGEPPMEAEREALFALGFTVLRIDYADKELWTSQHNFHGDWSCVKGAEPKTGRPMTVGIDPCPSHFECNDSNGQLEVGPCVLLFGHTGRHEHERKTQDA